jgi:GNAT superfamily N-acetyltransferase
MTTAIEVHPVTPERWADLEKLFGPHGAYSGCWCMFFRMRRKDWSKAKAKTNKSGLKTLVDANAPPGLLAYVDGEPAGWASLDPREKFDHLTYSRALKLDRSESGVWAIVCFVVGKTHRRRGVQTALIDAAVDYARSRGARAVEAYPIEPSGDLQSYDGYTGIRSSFLRAGFKEVRRVDGRRTVVRKVVG